MICVFFLESLFLQWQKYIDFKLSERKKNNFPVYSLKLGKINYGKTGIQFLTKSIFFIQKQKLWTLQNV